MAPLPVEADIEVVSLPTAEELEERTQRLRIEQRVRSAQTEVRQSTHVGTVVVPEVLEHCLPIVARTAKYFRGIGPTLERLEKAEKRAAARPGINFAWLSAPRTECGRYSSRGEGRLSIVATLTHIEWVLRFHEALLRALIAAGCKIVSRSAGQSGWVDVERRGEAVKLSFAEEYSKVPKSSASTNTSWSRWEQWDYLARDTFKLKVERRFGSVKIWAGRAADLESALPDIVRDVMGIIQAQAAKRLVVEAEAAARRASDAARAEESHRLRVEQEEIEKRKAARSAQIDRAQATGHAAMQYTAATQLLAELESRCSTGDEDAGIRAWIELVRSLLRDPVEALLAELRAETSVTDRPLWWPDGVR